MPGPIQQQYVITPQRQPYTNQSDIPRTIAISQSSGNFRSIKTPSKLAAILKDSGIDFNGQTRIGMPPITNISTGNPIQSEVNPILYPSASDSSQLTLTKEESETDRMYLIRGHITRLVYESDWTSLELPNDEVLNLNGLIPTNNTIITLGRMVFNKLWFDVKYDNPYELLIEQIISNSGELSQL